MNDTFACNEDPKSVVLGCVACALISDIYMWIIGSVIMGSVIGGLGNLGRFGGLLGLGGLAGLEALFPLEKHPTQPKMH